MLDIIICNSLLAFRSNGLVDECGDFKHDGSVDRKHGDGDYHVKGYTITV